MAARLAPVVRRVADLRAAVADWRRAGHRIGLIPTMGALHEGHLALVRRARAETARVVGTLFVNPTQFAPHEDLAAYPRDEARDLALFAEAGADLVFAPTVEEMYPPGFATTVSVAGLADHLCGPHRPGHFAGVATVVAKLLNQAQADAGYFGEKDWQQLQVIRRMAADLDIPTAIVGVPTVRDADGLALSSRNRYMSAAERERALALPRGLAALAGRVADGRPVAPEAAALRERLCAAGFDKIDYVEVADAETLQPLEKVEYPRSARVFAAAWMGRTRLIDNMPVA
ncbi:MAG: pantothenate synthetase [Alphaproteobacteria bacterium]|nr:MAG: pantothenate synthetase [Alphaproteobacteria bacterium]